MSKFLKKSIVNYRRIISKLDDVNFILEELEPFMDKVDPHQEGQDLRLAIYQTDELISTLNRIFNKE